MNKRIWKIAILLTVAVCAFSALSAADLNNTTYFPQFGGGADFSSEIILINTSATTQLAGFAQFFDAQGQPLEIDIEGMDMPTASVDFNLSPLAKVVCKTVAEGPVKSGSVVVTSDGSTLAGLVKFTALHETTGIQASTPQNNAIVPAQFNADGNKTGISVMNPTNQEQQVFFNLLDCDGVVVIPDIVQFTWWIPPTLRTATQARATGE